LEIIEDRLGENPTIISSQLSVENWYAIIREVTIADAILYKLVLTYRIEIKVKNLR